MTDSQHPPEPGQLEWTPSRVAQFWQVMSTRSGGGLTYFTALYADAIVKWFERHRGASRGLVIADWGTGWGHLAVKLADQGAAVIAIDQVQTLGPSALNCDRIRFVSYSDSATIQDGSLDGAFLIETLEHLDDAEANRVLQELRRLVKRGGFLLVTTPNEEDVDRNSVYCVGCNSVFHPWQHVRSVNVGWLSSTCSAAGWDAVSWEDLEFAPAGATGALVAMKARLAKRGLMGSRRRKQPHLVWLGVAR